MRAAVPREPWSVEREIELGRKNGTFPAVDRAALRLAGSSLSSVANLPSSAATVSVGQATDLLLQFYDGDRGAQRTRTNEAPTLPDFTEYLRQAKLWHDVLRTEEGESSSPCAQAAGRRARADSADRCQTDTSALASIERDVAAIFFQPDFDASDTTTFLRACPLGERSEAHLAAELTKQLDLVDSAIEVEVSRRARDLIEAASDMSQLHRSLTSSRSEIVQQRLRVARLADIKSREAADVTRLACRRRAMVALDEGLRAIADARQMAAAVQPLLTLGDYINAGDALAAARMLCSSPGTPQATCIAATLSQLQELETQMLGAAQAAVCEAATSKAIDQVTACAAQQLQAAAPDACGVPAFDLSRVSIEDLCRECQVPGIGAPVAPPGERLPAVWELQHTAMGPPLVCVYRLGSIDECLGRFENAAVTAARAAMAAHLRASVGAMLAAESAMAGASASTDGARKVEEQLRRLAPYSGISVLQSMLLLLDALLWFYEGCAAITQTSLQADAQVSSPQAFAVIEKRCLHVLQAVSNAFQSRWAKILLALFGQGIADAVGVASDSSPSLQCFQQVVDLSERVERRCASRGVSAAAVTLALRGIGKVVLAGHAEGLQAQVQATLDAETWTPCPASAQCCAFIDSLAAAGLPDQEHAPPVGRSAADSQSSSAPSPRRNTVANADVGSGHACQPPEPTAEHQRLSDAVALALGAGRSAESGASSPTPPNGEKNGDARPDARAASPVPPVVVAGERYQIVGSLAVLLQQIEASLAFARAVPALHFDMGQRVAQLLSLYNRRAQELLLGAAAIQTSGLRSITARHMAVCSQNLLLLEVLLPGIQRCAMRSLPPAEAAALASLYEAVCEGLAQHRQQLHSKLVGIMRQRLSTSLRQIHTASEAWQRAPAARSADDIAADSTGSADGDGASSPGAFTSPLFESVAKQLSTLQGVLEPILTAAPLADIFLRVYKMYSDSLARAVRSLQPGGASWLSAALSDVAALQAALRALPCTLNGQDEDPLERLHLQLQGMLAAEERSAQHASNAATASAACDVSNGGVPTLAA